MNRKQFIQAGGLTAGAALLGGGPVPAFAAKRDEVDDRRQAQLEAVLMFLDSLTPAQKADMYLPGLDTVVPTGKGIAVAALTTTAQKNALLHLMRLTEPLRPALPVTASDAQILELPHFVVYLTVRASVSVARKKAAGEKVTTESSSVPLFDYGSGQAAPLGKGAAQPYAKTTNAPGVFQSGRKNTKRDKRLEQFARHSKLQTYPASLPVPEAAFVNRARADYAALSPDQQKWLREPINYYGALPDASAFDWKTAVVYFDKTIAFNAALDGSGSPFPDLKGCGGFQYQIG